MARSFELLNRGVLVVSMLIGMSGCAGNSPASHTDAPTQLSEESRCARTGGVWRDNACRTATGGGGY